MGRRRWGVILVVIMGLVACSKPSSTPLQGYIEGKLIYLGSSQSGVLMILAVQKGQPVRAQQFLAQLDPNPERAQWIEAKATWMQNQEKLENLIQGQRPTVIEGILAERAKAQAELLLSEQTLRRNYTLYQQQFLSRQAYEESLADFRAKQETMRQFTAKLADAQLGARRHKILAQVAVVDAARARVAQLHWGLTQKTLYAPSDGFIFDTFYQMGEVVPANQPLLALLTPEHIHAIFFVPETKLSQLTMGQTVQLQCDGCSQSQSAIIDFISPEAEYTPPIIYSEKTRAKLVYRIEAKLPRDVALRYHPGQPVDVSL
ncbi:MAG TPA: HlyD family efflux transporter periplasmic adaptor subunit [Coxiellaceae bacterium]|nr:HlyD family efflux transporter periplasmic adaptor subunit [Coxiellaceae bacterium]